MPWSTNVIDMQTELQASNSATTKQTFIQQILHFAIKSLHILPNSEPNTGFFNAMAASWRKLTRHVYNLLLIGQTMHSLSLKCRFSDLHTFLCVHCYAQNHWPASTSLIIGVRKVDHIIIVAHPSFESF